MKQNMIREMSAHFFKGPLLHIHSNTRSCSNLESILDSDVITLEFALRWQGVTDYFPPPNMFVEF